MNTGLSWFGFLSLSQIKERYRLSETLASFPGETQIIWDWGSASGGPILRGAFVPPGVRLEGPLPVSGAEASQKSSSTTAKGTLRSSCRELSPVHNGRPILRACGHQDIFRKCEDFLNNPG